MTLRVVGHAFIKARFDENLPFNLVLVGPAGIGKQRLALYLAQRHATKFDTLVIGPAKASKDDMEKSVGIKQIREAGLFVAKRPFGSKFKIVVIDATRMTEAAAQALLRVLEDAHPRVRFIITTSGVLPLTILSRCAKVQVPLLSDVEVLEVLEMLGFTSDMAKTAAQLSKGSVAVALEHMNNAERRRAVLSVLQMIVGRKITAVLPIIRKWGEAEIVECVHWFEDLTLAPFGRMSSYTKRELAIGSAFTSDDVDKYLKLLRTPMKPSLKIMYFAIRVLESR